MRGTAAFVLSVVAVTTGIALLAVAATLGTSLGARWTLGLLEEIVPSELSAGAVRGSWLSGLLIENVRYADETVDAEVAALRIEPSLLALAQGRLELAELELRGGRVVLRAGDPPAAPAAAPYLPQISPRIGVRRLSATDVQVVVDDTTVEVSRVTGSFAESNLDIDSVQLAFGDVALGGSASIALAEGGARGALTGSLQPRIGSASWRIDVATGVVLQTTAEPWSVSFEWRRLAWLGSPAGDIDSAEGNLLVHPGAEPLAAALTARIEGTSLPEPATVTADVALRGRTLQLGELEVATLGGALAAEGEIDLAMRTGTVHVTARGFDPARVDARFAGNLHGDVDIELGAEPGLRIAAAGALGGELNAWPLDGALRAHYLDGTFDVERAELRVGDGHIDAAGTIGRETAQLRIAANVPDVGAWYPPARGVITGSAELSGTLQDPHVRAHIETRELGLDGAQAARVDTLALDLQGTLADHTIDARLSTAFGALLVGVEQGWDGSAWRGTVRDSTLAIVRAPTWTLAAPADYVIGAGHAELGAACYAGPAGSHLCATLQDRQLAVRAEGLPSQLAAPWLPSAVEVAGAADAQLELDWRDALRGQLALNVPALAVEPAAGLVASDDPRLRLDVTNVAVHGTVDAEHLAVSLGAGLAAGADRLDVSLELRPPIAAGSLTGQLAARLTDLAPLEAFVSGIGEVQGSIDAQLELSGSGAQPRVAGDLLVDSLRAAVPALGIEITDGELLLSAANLDEPILELAGHLCTAGCLTIAGRAQRPEDASWRAVAALAGERVVIADLPQLRAAVASDLEVVVRDNEWRMTGSLDVVDAAVTIETAPLAAVRPAPETVVFGRETATRSVDRVPASLVLDVQAHLSDVTFDGLGVSAELDGTLGLRRRPNGPLLVQGTAAVEQGTFRAYGQELMIERGLLIFTGPLDNPVLDIRATRTVAGSQVGIAVTGTASSARSEIFADDALSDSEALARLVTGRPLASAGTASAEALERAALGIGLSRVLPSLDRLGANLGLTELGVSSSTADVDGGLLVAGRQVGDALMLRYKHALLDDFASLELVYRITDRFRLHTESGTGRSIDLIYEVDPSVVRALRDLGTNRPSGSTPPLPPDGTP